MGNFGMELVIGGKDTLTPVMENAEQGYKRLEATARKSMGALADTAQRASLRVTTVAETAQRMSGSYVAATSEMARASTSQAAELDRIDSALAGAEERGLEFAEAMQVAAQAQEEATRAAATQAAGLRHTNEAFEHYAEAAAHAQKQNVLYTDALGRTGTVLGTMQQRMSAYAGTTAATNEVMGSRLGRVFASIRAGATTAAASVRAAFVGAAATVSTTMASLRAGIAATMTGIHFAVGEAAIKIYGSGERIKEMMERTSRASENMQNRVERATKFAVTAMVGMATGAVLLGASFEQSMAKVGSATNATPAQLVMMSNEALKWGTSTRYAAKEVAEAMALIGAETGNTAETMRTIGPVIKLAGGTMISLAESTGIVTQAMDAYNLKGSDAARISNALAAGANAGSTGMASMAQAFNGVSADAGAAGLTLEQTVAALAAMTVHGVPAGNAMTTLRTIIAQTQNPSDKLRAAMGGMSVEADGMWNVLQKLISTGPGLTALFGDARKFSGLAALQKEGVAGLHKYIEAVTGTNAAEAKFAANQNNVATQWAIFINQVKGVGIRVFQELSGSVNGTLAQMQGAVQRYGDKVVGMVIIAKQWVSQHKDQIAQVLRLAAVIGGLVAMLSVVATATIKAVAFFKALNDIWTFSRVAGLALRPVFVAIAEGVVGVVTTIGAAIGAGPLLLAAIGAALVGIVVHLYRTNDAFREWVHNLVDGAKNLGRDLLEHLTWPFRKWIEYASKAMSFLGDLFPGMREKVNAAMSWVADKASDGWHATSTAAQTAFNSVKHGAEDMGRSVANTAQTMAKNITAPFTNLVPDVTKMFSEVSAAGRKAIAQREFAAAGNPRLGQFQAQAYQNAVSNDAGTGGGGGAPKRVPIILSPTLAQGDMAMVMHEIASQWNNANKLIVESGKESTAEWLAARKEQIQVAYQQEVTGADVTAMQIAQARITRDNEMAAAIKQNQDAISMHEIESRKAALAEIVAANGVGTKAWLNARTQQITLAYQTEVQTADLTASQIVEKRMTAEQQIHEAKMQYQKAYMEQWMADNQLQVSLVQGFGSSYDSLIQQMIDKDNDHERRRRLVWESFKRTFISGVANMFKHYVTEQLKATILGHAVTEPFRQREHVAQAKAGAREAYKSQAGIPIIGPALAAAAMAQAFALLMAFHTGGLIGRTSGSERVIRVLPGEYVTQQRSVQSVGVQTMEYINRTGRLPNSGEGTLVVPIEINVHGGGYDGAAIREWALENIPPMLEDAIRDGHFTPGAKKGKYS